MRRDWVLDLIFDHFDVVEEMHDGHPVFAAYSETPENAQMSEKVDEKQRASERKVMMRFVPPVGGDVPLVRGPFECNHTSHISTFAHSLLSDP